MQERAKLTQLIDQANNIFLGKQNIIHLATLSILCQGHLLIEDRPGVGKTTLATLLAKLFGLKESRIQFTNDLLPTDLIGAMIYEQRTGEFTFKHGPIFGNMVIADELNRATPRTQSAMLQCMEERSISIDGENYPLPFPFVVMATQNPFQFIGTFELPESQIDRFFMGLVIDYPDRQSEKNILTSSTSARVSIDHLNALLTKEDLLAIKQLISQVHVSDAIVEYILDIIAFSRKENLFEGNADHLPLSVRAGLDLTNAAKAHAFTQGREFVTPDDIQFIAPAIIGHRLGGNRGILFGQNLAEKIIASITVRS